MKPWLNFRDLFSFRPPVADNSPPLLSENYKEFEFHNSTSHGKSQLEQIRFDNSMRIAISLLALVASFVLWIGDIIPTMGPVLVVFTGYIVLQLAGAVLLMKSSRYREINFLICSFDIGALSLGIHFTGHFESPLYFIYFMPLIVQAFHRDWALLVYYGVGGLVLYTLVISYSVPVWDSATLITLGTRISLMAFTVGIALLAVNLLRKSEVVERRRMSRMKCLMFVSQVLNGVGGLKELPSAIEKFVKVMNLELAQPLNAWSRIFLIQSTEPLMQVVQDPENVHPELKQSIPHNGCPAIQGNRPYEIKDNEVQNGCPMESFSMFRSHVCLPVSGEMNESFGVVFCGSPVPNAFQEEEIQFLQFIAKSLGLAIQRLRRVEELQLVFEMDSAAMATFLNSTRTMEDTAAAIVDGIRTILGADQVQLFLWDSEQARLVTSLVSGLFSDQAKREVYRMGEGVPGRVLESGKPYWTYNLDSNPLLSAHSKFRGVLAVPLQSIRGEPLGAILASVTSGQRTFSVDEIDLVTTFCTRAALAIENARMHHKERNPTTEEELTPEKKAA